MTLNSIIKKGKIPVLLAPMAGVTDYACRILSKKMGAGLVYSEFVSADGIIRENQKSFDLIDVFWCWGKNQFLDISEKYDKRKLKIIDSLTYLKSQNKTFFYRAK